MDYDYENWLAEMNFFEVIASLELAPIKLALPNNSNQKDNCNVYQ